MAWREEKRLVDVSRCVQLTRDADVVADAQHKKTELPEDEASAAIQSRQVFDTLAEHPGRLPEGGSDGGGGRPDKVLDVRYMRSAMAMCGLEEDEGYTMYASSKWAKRSGGTIDQDEFVALIERFSRPIRLRDQLLRRVHKYAADQGLRFVDVAHGNPDDDSGELPLTEDARGTDEAAVLKGWDDILDGLDHV